MKPSFRSLFLLVSISGLILSYQNCSQGGFKTYSGNENLSSLSEGGPSPTVTTLVPIVRASAEEETIALNSLNKLKSNSVSDCTSNSNYNTCLFWKNPVAQRGSPNTVLIGPTVNLTTIQNHAVNILPSWVNANGEFVNTSFEVVNENNQRLPGNGGNYKYPYQNDTAHRVSAAMAHYWLNFQKEFMTEWVGNFYAKNKNVKVLYWLDPTVEGQEFENAAWIPNVDLFGTGQKNNWVIMGAVIPNNPARPGDGQEFALSAEIYAHEMGHGNLSFATNGEIDKELGSKTITCGTDNESVCCSTEKGCSLGLHEGVADYHALILFPTSPAMGETLVNNSAGFAECGIIRDSSKLRALTLTQAYNACGTGMTGEVHLMGRIYASSWFEIRKAAIAAVGNTGAKDIDTIFSEHISTLAGSDDFDSASKKAVTVSKRIKGGMYTKIIIDEFVRRGLKPTM